MASNYAKYWTEIQNVLGTRGTQGFPRTFSVKELGKLTPQEVQQMVTSLKNAYDFVRIEPQLKNDKFDQRLITGYKVEIRPYTAQEWHCAKNAHKTLADLEQYIQDHFDDRIGWLVIPDYFFPSVARAAYQLEGIFSQYYNNVRIGNGHGRHTWQGHEQLGDWLEIQMSNGPLTPIP
jgi:hypothetical protein